MPKLIDSPAYKWLHGPTALVAYLVLTLVSYCVAFHFSESSNYARSSVSLYAGHVVALLVAASVATFLGYLVSAALFFFRLQNQDEPARRPGLLFFQLILLVFAAGLAGLTSTVTWVSNGAVSRFDAADIFAILFALFAVIADILECRARDKGLLSTQGKAIDLPLLLGIILVVSAKYILFDERAYSSWLTTRAYFPSGYPHHWEITVGQLTSDLRSGFWVGLGTGVVAVQMMVAVLGSAFLRMRRFGR